MGLDLFINDKYKILETIFNHRIQVKEDSYTSLSQQEIANIVHYSKQKTNKLVNELLEEGFIEYYMNLRGKYIVTTSGMKIIEVIKNTEI